MENSVKNKLKQLKSHNGFVKYFKNTSWVLSEKIIRLGFNFFIFAWVARYLGPEQYGIFSYAVSFVGLFMVFSSIGLGGPVVRELVEKKVKREELIATVFWLKFFGAVFALILLGISLYFIANNKLTNILILIIGFSLIFQSFNVIDYFFQSKVQSKYIVFANLVCFCVISTTKIVLILVNASLIYFAIVLLFESIILAIAYLYSYFNFKQKNSEKTELKSFKFNGELAKRLLKENWPMIFSGLAISFYMKFDQIMIKEMLNVESVGLYAIAVKFAEIWFFITVALTNSLYPSIVNAKKVSNELYYSRLQKFYQLLVLVSFLISVLVSLLSKKIVFYLFGVEYLQASHILVIYIWSNIFIFLNNGSWTWFITEKLQHLAVLRLFVGAVANIVLNYIFIKKYGLIGAAYATLISYSIATYFGNLMFKKTRVNFKIQTKAIFNVFNIRSYYR